jgi:Papain family cysteine protease
MYFIGKINLLLLFTYALFSVTTGQNYGTGLLIDDESFENNAKSVPLMRGDYQNLPMSISLKEYSPTPGSQGSYGTCTGWSSAYAGRTILEAMHNNWNKQEIDSNAFSPSYIYNQIKIGKGCFGGASIISALDVLKEQGGLKMSNFAYDCDLEVTDENKKSAQEYTIIEYREVSDKNTADKAIKVKKSLSEYKPIVIALDCPSSFYSAGELWTPKKTDYKRWSVGHALCVVGYDDEKYGGAFEIINSWSTSWGKGGYTWIKYEDFQYFCLFAFELIDKVIHEKYDWDLSGSLKFIESGNRPMRTTYGNSLFEMEKSYVSGTLFELFVSNNEPAYVYAFGTDTTNVTYKIFPFHNQMLAYLPYSENNFAIPDEGSYTMLDENSGTTYYCFLYSNEELDIDLILEKFQKNNKTFEENLKVALGNKLIDKSNILYTDGETITFKAKSKKKSILPVVVKIAHF